MSKENVELIRTAYQAYARGDVLRFVDRDLEWTSLDPPSRTPSRTCATVVTNWRPPLNGEQSAG